MEIYEGSENYIFISYAHKNSAQVMRVVEQLYARGYRIWYDEGITPGGEWPEIIARHLANCTAVLAFITPEFVASENCRREMTFADSHKKQRLSIFLEETELPLGVELQISLHQFIKRMNFRSEDAFLNRICQCEFLDSCKQKPNASILDVSVCPAKFEEKAPEAKSEEKFPEAKPEVKVPEVRSVEPPVEYLGINIIKKVFHGFCRMPALVLAAAVLLVLAGAFGIWRHMSIPTSAPESTGSVRYAKYAYSDDPSDNAMYTAEEFAKVVKSWNVQERLPLGTRIKMNPNSKEITDKYIVFELVAYKHFRRAYGLGMAKTTWLAVNLLNEERTMNEEWTNAGGWRDSEMRGWLNETLYPSLPKYWKNLMVRVAVSSTAGNQSTKTVTSRDYLFLPAVGEVDAQYHTLSYDSVFFSREISSDAEKQTFTRFTDNASRVKKRQGEADIYWLRSPSVSSATNFNNIYSSGVSGNGYAYTSYGVCPGFCM